jgi:hypothetical protein
MKMTLITIGSLSLLPCLFFTYYTVLLIYKNLVMTEADAAIHRTGGMLIGAMAFPLAAIVFGVISWFCFRRGFKRVQ